MLAGYLNYNQVHKFNCLKCSYGRVMAFSTKHICPECNNKLYILDRLSCEDITRLEKSLKVAE